MQPFTLLTILDDIIADYENSEISVDTILFQLASVIDDHSHDLDKKTAKEWQKTAKQIEKLASTLKI